MRGEYRFLKHTQGRCRFAAVAVEAVPAGDQMTVVDELPEQVRRAEGEVNRHSEPVWVAAALEGMREAASAVHPNGVAGTGFRLSLVRLVGTLADTTEDAVRCAAGLAAWRSLRPEGPAPEPQLEGTVWKLHFPAPPAASPTEEVRS
jgi:hypothetical protein